MGVRNVRISPRISPPRTSQVDGATSIRPMLPSVTDGVGSVNFNSQENTTALIDNTLNFKRKFPTVDGKSMAVDTGVWTIDERSMECRPTQNESPRPRGLAPRAEDGAKLHATECNACTTRWRRRKWFTPTKYSWSCTAEQTRRDCLKHHAFQKCTFKAEAVETAK
ncbi:hypothetical protein BKA93DRAFT_750851 [Sparassis latifolia]